MLQDKSAFAQLSSDARIQRHAKQLSKQLQLLRERLFPPTAEKLLRTFTSGEAAQLGSGLIDPEYDCCGDADCREEGVSASIVARCDATPVLELGEQVLDSMALTVDDFVVREGNLAATA